MSTLFTKIIQWEIPSYKIYEDNLTCAFLNIFPVQKGDILIVPKIEVDHFFELEEPYYSAIFQLAKKLAPVLQKVGGYKRISLVIEGLEVPHAHIRLAGIHKPGDFDADKQHKASEEELVEMQAKLIEELNIH